MSAEVFMRARLSLLAIVALPVLACGGGGGGTTIDAPKMGHDTGPDGPIPCIAATSYAGPLTMASANDELQAPGGNGSGSAGSGSGSGSAGSGSGGVDPGADFLDYEGALDPTTSLEISLYTGTSDFPGSTVGPETKDLSGSDDSQFATCGSCVLLYAGIGSDGVAQETFLATGGTLTVTSTTTNFAGTLANLVLTQIDIDDQTEMSSPDPQGCASSIASLSFTAPIAIDTGSGDIAPHARVHSLK
jgi:hypothetical protein